MDELLEDISTPQKIMGEPSSLKYWLCGLCHKKGPERKLPQRDKVVKVVMGLKGKKE